MKYRQRPVVVEAIQWTGANNDEIEQFLGDDFVGFTTRRDQIHIETLEGVMTASIGDYIIEGIEGEHYACKDHIFDETYEKVD